MEKIEVKEAKGKLGILVVGVGGAVATTMITGTLAARKGLAKPIGSISQLATMRLENGEEKAIKDIVPLTDLNDIVFGGWDIFPDNAYGPIRRSLERKRPERRKRRIGGNQTDAGRIRP